MIQDEIRENVKSLDSYYEKILEDYVSENFMESIAKVLCYLPAEKSEKKLQEFPEPYKSRILELKEKFKEDENAVNLQVLQLFQTYDTKGKDKISDLIFQLNKVPLSESQEILEQELSENPVVLAKLNSLHITFSDFLRLSDRDVQKVLREVDDQELACALKMASGKVREKIFRNMSKNAAQMLQDKMDFLGPVRKQTVIDNQAHIISIIKALEERGIIVFADKEDDFIE